MRKSILTMILCVACYCISFAQQSRTGISVNENLVQVEKIVDEKSDITGTFSNSGQWNVYVDDAKLSMQGEMVKEIKSDNIQDLLQAGFAYVKKTRSADICYRYRIAAATDGEHSMKLYECR